MAQKNHKLDIFHVLNKISVKDREYYASLTEDQQKALQPFVLMRWLTGTKSPMQIYLVNELVNRFVFSLQKHKQLLVFLLSACTGGSSQRYYWNKPKSKETNTPHLIGVIREYFKYNTNEAIDALPLLTDEDILWYAEELGNQPDEIKLIKKELKNRVRL